MAKTANTASPLAKPAKKGTVPFRLRNRFGETAIALAKAVIALFAITSTLTATAQAQTAPSGLRAKVDSWVRANQQAIVRELVQLLSIPNVAADRENIRKNATLLREMLARRGFTAEVLETRGLPAEASARPGLPAEALAKPGLPAEALAKAGNPLVWGELEVPGATRTLLLYAHYDGQPVNPKDWRQTSPFTPILRDGRMEDGAKEIADFSTRRGFEPHERIYARSASDDKSPIVALLTAVDALKAAGIQPSSNIRVILDGEEEAGSPSLVPAIGKYRDKLTADAMFIFDGPVHPSERPTIVYGARGNLAVQLTVYGPKFPLHSGHYGNWAPNPAMRLAELLATLKDDNGKVAIEGFYDGIPPFTPEERAILDAVPDDPAALQKLFGIAGPERPGLKLQEALQYPSLNVRGLSSAFIGGEARTIIPSTAIAELDIRLVKETPAARVHDLLVTHIRKLGWHLVSSDPDDPTRATFSRIVKVSSRGDGTNAYRTSPLLPISKQLVASMTAVFGEPPVQIRTSGGTVPIAPFIDALGFPALSVPIVNFDNNQHGENENLRLGHFFRGITTLAAVLTM